MSSVQSDGGFPKVEGQAPDVFYGSPLALVGLFTEVIRARFRGSNNHTPWIWLEDPTPEDSEQNTPEAPRRLYVESQLSDDPEARTFNPAVLVDKEETRLLKPVVGNRAGLRLTDRLEGFFALAVIPMSVICLSTQRGESANLADHVWMHITACQNLVRSTFGIHEISPATLGRTQVFRRTEGTPDRWNTPIMFEVQIAFRWLTRPIAPLLQEVHTKLELAGNGDSGAGAIRLAQISTRRR
jgi:hypothetical protein